jgi:cobalt-zinc-cadmium efflux system protein
MTVHLVKPDADVDDDWLHHTAQELHERFHIDHPTIQIESGQGHHACRLAPDDVV